MILRYRLVNSVHNLKLEIASNLRVQYTVQIFGLRSGIQYRKLHKTQLTVDCKQFTCPIQLQYRSLDYGVAYSTENCIRHNYRFRPNQNYWPYSILLSDTPTNRMQTSGAKRSICKIALLIYNNFNFALVSIRRTPCCTATKTLHAIAVCPFHTHCHVNHGHRKCEHQTNGHSNIIKHPCNQGVVCSV